MLTAMVEGLHHPLLNLMVVVSNQATSRQVQEIAPLVTPMLLELVQVLHIQEAQHKALCSKMMGKSGFLLFLRFRCLREEIEDNFRPSCEREFDTQS
jgi:hypothetical protein